MEGNKKAEREQVTVVVVVVIVALLYGRNDPVVEGRGFSVPWKRVPGAGNRGWGSVPQTHRTRCVDKGWRGRLSARNNAGI